MLHNAHPKRNIGSANRGEPSEAKSGKSINVVHTAISRKVFGKKVHATISNGNMGYDKYTVSDTSCRTYFCYFALALGNIVHGLSCHSFKISNI